MAQDRMTFSFRCPRSLKDAFSAKAKANGTTASALIKDFMQAYVDGSNDKSIDKKATTDEQCHNNNQQSSDTDDGIDNQRIKDLEAKLEFSHRLLERLQLVEDNQANLADRTWALENSALTKLDYLEGLSCPFPQCQNAPAGESNEGKSTDNSSESTKGDHSNLLTGAALAKRLGGITPTAVKKQWEKGEEKFKQWSQGRDPDGRAWSYDPTIGKWGKYYPIS
jgi:predicted DNA-binding protein